jgi:uncharacterized membrane protein YhhN
MKNTLFFKIYIAFSIVYLFILLFRYDNLDLLFKPVLMPLLGFGVYVYPKFPLRKFLLRALVLSWIGDVILLFADIAEIYFILALISFLISHILYSLIFNKQTKIQNNNKKIFFLIGSLVIACYLIAMILFLMPTLGNLEIPVIVYASVISTMLLFAFNGFLVWEKPGNIYIFTGALIFVISDSILAVNKFHHPIEKSSFYIMLTYLVAQYLIVMGIIKLNSSVERLEL